jgi:hypothetical protein
VSGVLSGWMLLFGGAGFLRLAITLVMRALCSPLCLVSEEENTLTGCERSHLYGLSVVAGPRCIHIFASPSGVMHLSDDSSSKNMVLLVAGLQGIDSYGLYQFGSLADRKRKDVRSVAPYHLSFSSIQGRVICQNTSSSPSCSPLCDVCL